MANFICQNEVNMTNESLKIPQALLERSTELDQLRCITNTTHCPVSKITEMVANFPTRELCCDGELQLTTPWSAKILLK